MTKIEPFKTYKGKFLPKIDENLRAEAQYYSQKEMYFKSLWVIEDGGDYVGQWAMEPFYDIECRHPILIGWIPQEDIKFDDVFELKVM